MLLFLAHLGSASTAPSPPRPLAPPCTMGIYRGDKICLVASYTHGEAGEAGEELGLQGAEGLKIQTARSLGCVMLACILLGFSLGCVALRLLDRKRQRHAEQPAQRGLLVLAPPPPSLPPPLPPPPPMPLMPPSLPPSLPPQLGRPEDEEALLAQELHAQELVGLAAEVAEAAEAESLSRQLSESAAVAMALHEREVAAAVSAAVELRQAMRLHELQQAQVRRAAEEAASEALVQELQQYSRHAQVRCAAEGRQAQVRRAAEEAASETLVQELQQCEAYGQPVAGSAMLQSRLQAESDAEVALQMQREDNQQLPSPAVASRAAAAPPRCEDNEENEEDEEDKGEEGEEDIEEEEDDDDDDDDVLKTSFGKLRDLRSRYQ